MAAAPVYHFLGDFEHLAETPTDFAALSRLLALALRGYADCAGDERDDDDEGLLQHVAETVAYIAKMSADAHAAPEPPTGDPTTGPRRLHAVQNGKA